MTIHMTGAEFSALINAIEDMGVVDIVKAEMSSDLYITIKQIDDDTYNTTITNKQIKFID